MNAKITVASVNKMLKGLGIQERLVNNSKCGYFYFYEGSAHTWNQTSVYVTTANDLTLEQWLEEYHSLKNR